MMDNVNFKPRLETKNRQSLENAPMDTPICFVIDPSSGCNFKCAFCPTGDPKLLREVGRVNTVMKMDVYKKIIDDCREFDGSFNTLKLYKEGEPLLNKNIVQMVDYAKKSGCFDRIFITTNGSLLTPELSDQLIEAGLDVLHVSLEGMSSKTYKSFAKVDIDFEELVKNITYYYNNRGNAELSVKVVAENLMEGEEAKYVDTFKNISDSYFIERISPVWPEFDVSDLGTMEQTVYGETISDKKVCPYLFYQFVVNADATVSACCVDWGRKLIIGDLVKQSVADVWNSEELKALRKTHLEFKRDSIDACKNCGQISHAAKDNLDEYAEDILSRL
jgi:radical SAM protein with 4Fe4S-binding SPASM domain